MAKFLWPGRSLLLSLLLVAAIPLVAQQPIEPHASSPLASEMRAGFRTPALDGPSARRAQRFAPDRVLIRFRPAATKEQQQQLRATTGASKVKEFRIVQGLQLLRLPAGVRLADALRQYRRSPNVLYAEPDYKVSILRSPDDPAFSSQWALHNTGQNGGTSGADIHAPEAWELTTGSADVVVGIIDTGVDYTHPDLAANIWSNSADCNANGVDDDGDGYVDDCHGIDVVNGDSDPMDDVGHGTHVAGIIGAVGNNSLGVVGVNWQVRMAACKFLDSAGSGYLSGAITCLEYFQQLRAAGVNLVATNNSWGGGGYSRPCTTPSMPIARPGSFSWRPREIRAWTMTSGTSSPRTTICPTLSPWPRPTIRIGGRISAILGSTPSTWEHRAWTSITLFGRGTPGTSAKATANSAAPPWPRRTSLV